MRTVKSHPNGLSFPRTRESKFRLEKMDSRVRGNDREEIGEPITFGRFLRECAGIAALILIGGVAVIVVAFLLIVFFAHFY